MHQTYFIKRFTNIVLVALCTLIVLWCLAGSSGNDAGNGNNGSGSGGGGKQQHTRRRTQRRVTHNEKRYHSGSPAKLAPLYLFAFALARFASF